MKKSQAAALFGFGFSLVGFGVNWATADWLWSASFFITALLTGTVLFMVSDE